MATLIGIDEKSWQAIAASEQRWFIVSVDSGWEPQEIPERSAHARLASGALTLVGVPRAREVAEPRLDRVVFESLDALIAEVRARCIEHASRPCATSSLLFDELRRLSARGVLQPGPAPSAMSDIVALVLSHSASASPAPHNPPKAVDLCLELLYERYHAEVFAFAFEALQLAAPAAEELTLEVFRHARYAIESGETPDLQWCWREAFQIFEVWMAESSPPGN